MSGRSIVLGYSGLHGSEEFRRHWLGKESNEQNIRTHQGQDAAAAIVIDGELVAAVQEERFSGKKFDGDLPTQSITWCLATTGLEPRDITRVAHNFDYRLMAPLFDSSSMDRALFKNVYSPAVQSENLRQRFPDFPSETHHVKHHLAHAYSGVTAAGLDEAAVLVVDGLGEIEATSMFHWSEGGMRRLRSLGPSSSLGIFYSLVTEHLGYLPASDEYKVMGLAALGDHTRFAPAMKQAIQLTQRGIYIPVLDWTDGEHRYLRSFEWLTKSTIKRRLPNTELDDRHKDLAAALQHRLSTALLHLVDQAIALTQSRRLVVVGGVALNCAAIGHIAKHRDLEALFVPPAPGDEGTAIGAALAASTPNHPAPWPRLPLLGPKPTWNSPSRPHWQLPAEVLADVLTGLLAADAIVGWANGRLEFGPRALGSRSILASPRSTKIRDRLNLVVKDRELFRPLAPVVLSSEVDAWFDVPDGLNVRHMTAAVPVRQQKRTAIAGAVHVDGTARIQSLEAADQPLLFSLISSFYERTGIPMLLNTSLNVRGQPIARTADDALEVFDRSDLDAVAISDGLWVKPRWRSLVSDLIARSHHAES